MPTSRTTEELTEALPAVEQTRKVWESTKGEHSSSIEILESAISTVLVAQEALNGWRGNQWVWKHKILLVKLNTYRQVLCEKKLKKFERESEHHFVQVAVSKKNWTEKQSVIFGFERSAVLFVVAMPKKHSRQFRSKSWGSLSESSNSCGGQLENSSEV
jgi:hypothetical protein